jgi:hypothetical protein
LRLGLILLLAARLIGLSTQSLHFLRRSATTALAILLIACAVRARAEEPALQQATELSPPSADILATLKEKLTRAEACAPACVTTPMLTLTADSDRLSLSAEVHAAAQSTWAIPGPSSVFVPADVKVDGQPEVAIARLADGFLHIRLAPGIHRIEIEGALPRVDSLTLQLQDRPHHAQARSASWEIAGVRENGPPDASIQLSRRLRSGQRTVASGSHLSTWLEVDRTLEIGVTWRVLTTVRRASPVGVPIAVRVPLLAGEALTEGGWETDKGEVAVTLNRDETEARWASTLPIQEKLELIAPEGKLWSEVWRVQCGVVWQCASDGLAPVARLRDGTYEPEYRPWPGEKLALRFSRPLGVQGQTVTIESSQMSVEPGTRLEATRLTLTTRASREETISLGLPSGVELQEVKIGGNARPIRPDGSRLTLNLPPGRQGVEIRWQRSAGLAPLYSAPRVTLPFQATNVFTKIKLPADRWLLFVWGPAWGPALLFWSYLIFVLIVAAALARVPDSPLTMRQWLLLSLGLAQIPALAALIVVFWFFALLRRKQRPLSSAIAFDLAQVLLVVWTLIALICLYAAIHTGLLLKPDMQVAGNGSSASDLRWYADQASGLTPFVAIVSLPLWIYRVAMLLWSLWLASSLVRWSVWAWHCLNEGGNWRALPKSQSRIAAIGTPAQAQESARPDEKHAS